MDVYLQNKRRKIQDNNSNIEQISALFKGKSFYLNGYLDGVAYGDFKLLILKRGGLVYDYLSSNVTHIIASTITNSKSIMIKKPIIRPDWIHDCISQDKILPIHSYLLNSSNNMTLDFKSVESSSTNVCSSTGLDELDLNDPFIRQNTTLDPDFLTKFFAKSRLHHLTSWKHELIDYVSQNLKTKSSKSQKKLYMHVDLDAFFVSVSLLDKPHLKNSPVVIAHSTFNSDESTAEIASCNYVARGFGIKNGMRLASAKSKCTDLQVLPYDFEKYREVSRTFFNVLLKYANQIQVNSCDEAFIDVSNQIEMGLDVLEVGEIIRREVFETTGGCTASVGCGPNILLARLATYKAKPNGIFWVKESQVGIFLKDVPIDQLPGIGWSYQEKLSENGIYTVGDLRKVSRQMLKTDYGLKTGEMMYQFSRGIDERELENKGRQSLGVDINWGVRFQNHNQISCFFKRITDYVSERLRNSRLKASHITVKAKKRLYKGEPEKFLGCGHCENLSKSNTMRFTDDSDTLFNLGYPLLCKLSVDPADLRGIGLSVKMFDQNNSKTSPIKKTNERQETIEKYLSPIKASTIHINSQSCLQNLNDIDPEIFKQLPTEIQREIMGSADCSNPPNFKVKKFNSFATPRPKSKAPKKGFFGNSKGHFSPLDAASPELMSNPGRMQMSDAVSLPSDYDPNVFKALPSSIQRELKQAHGITKFKSKKELDMDSLMPSSSQLDPSVLNELPESIKKEVLGYRKRRDTLFMQKLRGAQTSIILHEQQSSENLEVLDNPYPSLGGETDPLTIYNILNEWIISSPCAPQPEGVSELKTYLEDLAKVGDLVRIRNILLYLEKRLCINSTKGKTNSAWNSLYSQIYNFIHQVITQKYRARLEMKV